MDSEIKNNCDIALKNRLYVSGWSMSGEYLRGRKYGSSYLEYIDIYYIESKPVGAITLTVVNGLNIFVKKAYRRKGIGSILLSKMKESLDIQDWSEALYGECGIEGYEEFFHKNKCNAVLNR